MPYPEALKAIQGLIRNAETLAALGALCSAKAGAKTANEAISSKLIAVQEAVEPSLMNDIGEEDAQFLHLTVRANLRRALELVEAEENAANWGFDDPTILQAQGKSSRVITRLISGFAERTPTLSDRLDQNARFLDVGSGTGWISITMAERWPSLAVDGFDIHVPALELAEENRIAADMYERVHFFNRNVADLSDQGKYAAAFIPIMFIPQPILELALPALYRAIELGGWLFVAGFRAPDEPLMRALNDLQTTLFGGRVWEEGEATALISHHGFQVVEDIGSGTPINLFAARKH
jgi:2-polyprenyl-3-methyl-5-hydroxy-6-metoxy-1,4-benzoquinol methylase